MQVRRRVGKYAQPDHPMRITQDEAGQVCGGVGWSGVCVWGGGGDAVALVFSNQSVRVIS